MLLLAYSKDKVNLKLSKNIQDFVGSRMETGVSGKIDLIVFCDEGLGNWTSSI